MYLKLASEPPPNQMDRPGVQSQAGEALGTCDTEGVSRDSFAAVRRDSRDPQETCCMDESCGHRLFLAGPAFAVREEREVSLERAPLYRPGKEPAKTFEVRVKRADRAGWPGPPHAMRNWVRATP